MATRPAAPGRARGNGLLGAYWIAFAAWTLWAARTPGLVPDPASVPYPWTGVLATWAILAVLTGALGLVLRGLGPRTSRRAWGRWVGALAYAVVLLAVTFTGFTTDMPSYEYVPPLFAAVTGVGLLCVGVMRALQALRTGRRGTHAP